LVSLKTHAEPQAGMDNERTSCEDSPGKNEGLDWMETEHQSHQIWEVFGN
jgi:hypothetical protein